MLRCHGGVSFAFATSAASSFGGFGYRVSGIGLQVSDVGFLVSGFRFRFSGFGVRVTGFGIRDSGFGFGVSGFGFRDSGFGFRVSGVGIGISLGRFPLVARLVVVRRLPRVEQLVAYGHARQHCDRCGVPAMRFALAIAPVHTAGHQFGIQERSFLNSPYRFMNRFCRIAKLVRTAIDVGFLRWGLGSRGLESRDARIWSMRGAWRGGR